MQQNEILPVRSVRAHRAKHDEIHDEKRGEDGMNATSAKSTTEDELELVRDRGSGVHEAEAGACVVRR